MTKVIEYFIVVGIDMITEIEIQNFLYEIDNDYNLTDDQINALAKQIFDNQKILLDLIKNGTR